MLVLALETSAHGGSVAILHDGVLHEVTLAKQQRSAQGLAPAIDQLLKSLTLRSSQFDLIAVTAGPGSFTGLRVGVMTAKTLAFAWGCQLLGIDTLEVIARQAVSFLPADGAGRIHALLDAQREQLFAAVWEQNGADWQEVTPPRIVDRTPWLASLQVGEVVTGPGLKPLLALLPATVVRAPETVWEPTAAMVGQLALERAAAGKFDSWQTLAPRYFRLSAAEEKRLGK